VSGRRTEDRIADLVRDLEPVRPIPPLGAVAAGAVTLGLLAYAAEWILGGPGLRSDGAWSQAPYLMQLAGLVLGGPGATLAALASAVPGREPSVRVGLRVAALGLAMAILGGVGGALLGGLPAGGQDPGPIVSCVVRSAKLGIAASLLSLGFGLHAAARRPSRTLGLALAGGVALGATAVHLTCPSGSAVHQLLGHALAPVLVAGLVVLPLAPLLGRRLRRV